MVTSSTWERRDLFRNERWANLLIDTVIHYRGSAYLVHELVIMPDHFPALITSVTSLEKAVQFIGGGFSYHAKTELGSSMEVWQKGLKPSVSNERYGAAKAAAFQSKTVDRLRWRRPIAED